MEYILLKYIPSQTYLSLVDPVGKSRFVCFSEKLVAGNCIKYVSNFKFRYGVWPILDMSENRRKVEPVLNGIIETPNDIEKEMELQHFVYDDIDKMSMRSNVSFYCILDFNTLTNNGEEMIAMTGQEMDGHADDYMYRRVLNDSLNIT